MMVTTITIVVIIIMMRINYVGTLPNYKYRSLAELRFNLNLIVTLTNLVPLETQMYAE